MLFGICVYISAQFLIGYIVSLGIKTESDYLLAGRKLGLLLGTFTIFATWFGTESCISTTGNVFFGGLSASITDPFGYSIALLTMGLVFASILWRNNLTTLADLFRQRYGTSVERLALLLMVPTSLMWAAAQIRGFATILSVISTTDEAWLTLLATILVITYTTLGGMLADAYNDFIQGSVIIIGLLILTVVLTLEVGGLSIALSAIDKTKLTFSNPELSWLEYIDLWATPILGSLVAQELVARVLSSRSPMVARRSAVTAAAVYLIVGLMPVFIGLISSNLLPGITEDSSEQVLTLLAQKYLHPVLFVIFCGAIVSGIFSTVDTTLLVSSSLVVHNLVIPLQGNISEKTKVKLNRLGVVCAGIIAYILASSADSIYELVQEASSFGSAGLVVVMIFGLFSKFGESKSAIASLLTGVGVYAYGSYIAEWPGAYVISVASATVAYVLANKIPTRTVSRLAH